MEPDSSSTPEDHDHDDGDGDRPEYGGGQWSDDSSFQPCDMYHYIPLPRPLMDGGTLFASVRAVNIINQTDLADLHNRSLEQTDGEANGIDACGTPADSVRWDGIEKCYVPWRPVPDRPSQLTDSCKIVVAYDKERKRLASLMQPGNCPPLRPPDLQSEDTFHQLSYKWEQEVLLSLKRWNTIQSQLFAVMKHEGHPLLYEGISRSPIYPEGIAWLSGDGYTEVRQDSLRSELHLAHVLRALLFLRRGLRIAGSAMFMHMCEMLEEVELCVFDLMQRAKTLPPQSQHVNLESECSRASGSWSVPLREAQQCFVRAFVVICKLQRKQHGWSPLQMDSRPPCELREPFALAVQSTAIALAQRCSYLLDLVYPSFLRSVMKYKRRARKQPAAPESATEEEGDGFDHSREEPRTRLNSQFDFSDSIGTQSALDVELWEEWNMESFNLQCIASLSFAQHRFACALSHINDAFVTQDYSRLQVFIGSMHYLHAGALLHHLSTCLLSCRDDLGKALLAGCLDSNILAVLRKVSASLSDEQIGATGGPASSSSSASLPKQGPLRSASHTKEINNKAFTTGALARECGVKAIHLASLYFARATRAHAAVGAPAWIQLLSTEVATVYMKFEGRYNPAAVEMEISGHRALIKSEQQKLRMNGTLSALPAWHHLMFSYLMNEVLKMCFDAEQASDWNLCGCAVPSDAYLAITFGGRSVPSAPASRSKSVTSVVGARYYPAPPEVRKSIRALIMELLVVKREVVVGSTKIERK